MTVYITRYALTEGIYLAEVELSQTDDSRVTVLRGRHSGIFHKPDWHVTWTDAINRAEKMRKQKIQSLQTQIACLKRMDFYRLTNSENGFRKGDEHHD
ncbi:hypothetical protein [Ethanoligenens sp.]|uniref:hypothetical protein n=1 Tax=Ethanoligenens sp. TaxID=2099655 RepID=UPI0039E8479F